MNSLHSTQACEDPGGRRVLNGGNVLVSQRADSEESEVTVDWFGERLLRHNLRPNPSQPRQSLARRRLENVSLGECRAHTCAISFRRVDSHILVGVGVAHSAPSWMLLKFLDFFPLEIFFSATDKRDY